MTSAKDHTNESLQLRSAQTADLDFVEQCAERAYSIYVERIGKPPAPMIADFAAAQRKQNLEIIISSGVRTGFIVSFSRDNHLFVENIAIHPDFQNQGIAKRVFAVLVERSKRIGHSAIELYTNEMMTENLTFYPKLGFRETDRRSEAGFNRVYFRLDL
ncbi:MAG: GNAT family N-acetyltransferase [Rhizobiaceae bacterium]